jgi:isocitrate dehydrogenase (NAD+)
VFEQGARHVALDIAGRDLVNPTGSLLSAVMMLRHLKLGVFADRMERAIFETLAGGIKTKDVGGTHSTTQVLDAIVNHIQADSNAKVKTGKGISRAV